MSVREACKLHLIAEGRQGMLTEKGEIVYQLSLFLVSPSHSS